jgi:hypothetical protein
MKSLLLCSSYLPLGVPNGLLLTSHQQAARKEKSYQRNKIKRKKGTILYLQYQLHLSHNFSNKVNKSNQANASSVLINIISKKVG